MKYFIVSKITSKIFYILSLRNRVSFSCLTHTNKQEVNLGLYALLEIIEINKLHSVKSYFMQNNLHLIDTELKSTLLSTLVGKMSCNFLKFFDSCTEERLK